MRSKELWPFLFFLGLLFFNWPLLELVGIPLPYYLYTLWAVFILVVGLLASSGEKG
jgi:hypothetical protein